jgi:hypothetical protein
LAIALPLGIAANALAVMGAAMTIGVLLWLRKRSS